MALRLSLLLLLLLLLLLFLLELVCYVSSNFPVDICYACAVKIQSQKVLVSNVFQVYD